MKATSGNSLNPLGKCYISIPGIGRIMFNNLPDIGDSKGANYGDETGIGRSASIKTFSSSENRSITLDIPLIATKKSDFDGNIAILRAISSLVYPRYPNEPGANGRLANSGVPPYSPPTICKLKCGELLGNEELCVVMKNYSVKFPTDVPWDQNTYTPVKFNISTTWDVVYKNNDLPGQARIFQSGV